MSVIIDVLIAFFISFLSFSMNINAALLYDK